MASRPPPKWWPTYLEGIRDGLTRSHAAEAAGIDRGNAHHYLERNPDREQEVIQAELSLAGDVTGKIYQIAMDDDHPKQAEMLKHLSRVLKHYNPDPVPPPSPVQVNLSLPPSEIEERLSSLVARLEERKAIDVESTEVDPRPHSR